ncbi:hypothetical protein ACLQ3C_01670 [Gordonia sp. DT30]|uniref:hypothetical protein n=1 Tax=unclassified Gordonia (in: high G+C Gram-positive bacteria) TaxID=2657482 RepID=UPI003CECED70
MSEQSAAQHTDTAQHTETAGTPAVRIPREVVSSIEKFAAREGGSAKAVLAPVGAAGVRITLVGEKGGILGDRVVPDLETAKAVVAAATGVETAEWDRDLTSSADVEPGRYRKMAGWVAGQKRFPKPRNRAIL